MKWHAARNRTVHLVCILYSYGWLTCFLRENVQFQMQQKRTCVALVWCFHHQCAVCFSHKICCFSCVSVGWIRFFRILWRKITENSSIFCILNNADVFLCSLVSMCIAFVKIKTLGRVYRLCLCLRCPRTLAVFLFVR